MKNKITKDKWLHFGVCAIASVINPWLGIGLGLGKEYGDSKASGNKWDWYDILADAIGIIVGGALHFVLVYYIIK